ncbi:hypothetical protein GCM10011375_35440 [Hymenobacter qilianensis]|uniref:YtkA-like domain-containing protein n=2 Tax=Hymenobacter qilianensis TaxID=1385715 RepID=A0A7H0GSF1_9BACT|nr:hypothetical protein [Hymenobacter qilianensis]QNP51217.1 hypothetical protein H9L05_14170 [Hymenobacter qilianensis]GGF77285.1 hypothetical protein GCM10011375_35440 [Hymenobacter qilianensis]
MKTYLFVFLLLGLLGFGAPAATAHGGEDHGETATATAAGAQYFSVTSQSAQFELLLRYEPIKAGEPAHLRLFVSDFATNAPISGARLTFTVPENDKLQFAATPQGPGEYLVEGQFPANKAYGLTVNIVADKRADLMLLKGIEVGKELPVAAVLTAEPFLTCKMGLLLLGGFLAGVALTALLLRRRTRVTTAQPPLVHS